MEGGKLAGDDGAAVGLQIRRLRLGKEVGGVGNLRAEDGPGRDLCLLDEKEGVVAEDVNPLRRVTKPVSSAVLHFLVSLELHLDKKLPAQAHCM